MIGFHVYLKKLNAVTSGKTTTGNKCLPGNREVFLLVEELICGQEMHLVHESRVENALK